MGSQIQDVKLRCRQQPVQAAYSGSLLLYCASMCGWQALKNASNRGVRLQCVPIIGIAIDQLPDFGDPAARGWCPSRGAAARLERVLAAARVRREREDQV